jgi:hypothetical protein
MNMKIVTITATALTCLLPMQSSSAGDLARVNFQEQTSESEPGVFDHGTENLRFLCDGSLFDYVDPLDSGVDCFPAPAAQGGNNLSNVSGGGRWHFNVWEDSPGDNERNLTIDFSAPQNSGDCVRLNSELSDLGLDCGCDDIDLETTCVVNVWISASNVFKKNASTDQLSRFDIVESGGTGGVDGPDIRITYHTPLNICDAAGQNSNDKDWKVLQSGPCGSADLMTDSMADVVIPPTGGSGQDDVLGQWYLPFQVTVNKVSVSSGEEPPPSCTDDDGDGSCVPEDCNDADSSVYPGQNDTKGKWGRNGIDNDCNGIIDG